MQLKPQIRNWRTPWATCCAPSMPSATTAKPHATSRIGCPKHSRNWRTGSAPLRAWRDSLTPPVAWGGTAPPWQSTVALPIVARAETGAISRWGVRSSGSRTPGGGSGRSGPNSLLGGASRAEAAALVDRDLLGKDPMGAFDGSLAAQAGAFADEGALERACKTIRGGPGGRQLLRFRTTDLVLHAWDLARAIGTNECLEAVAVEHIWGEMEPVVPVMGSMGVFGDGPSGTLP